VNEAFVADCSVAVAWVVRSQAKEEQVLLLLDNVLTGAPMVVPVLWAFEVANALLTLLRRRVIQDDQYERARQELRKLQSVVDEEGPRLALQEISTLANAHSLSVYDAVYLELALCRAMPLASRDAALNRAAKRIGVRTLL
jgi:predicted nucleic acid-binding protein